MTQVSAPVHFYAYISGSWTLLDDVTPAYKQWGIGDNKSESRMAEVGEHTITLNNSTGIYTRGGPNGLAGWKLGIPFKEVVTYESSDYIRFIGVIDRIQREQRAGDKTITITVVDWLSYAQKYPIENSSLLEDATISDGVAEILANVPVNPLDIDISTGTYVFPTLLDTVQGGTKAYIEFMKFVMSEPSYGYVKHNVATGEQLVIEQTDTRNGTRTPKLFPLSELDAGYLLAEEGSYILAEDGSYITQNWGEVFTFDESVITAKNVTDGENITNRFVTNAYPKKRDDYPVLVYQTEKPIRISANTTNKKIRVFWRDPTGKRPINAVPPSGNATDVALCHFDLVNVSGGGLNGSGLGVGGVFVDDTGKRLIDHDAPYIDFSQFGDGSMLFDGSLAWAEYPYYNDWNFGSNDFWVEWRDYRYAATSGQTAISRDGTDATPSYLIGGSDGTNYTVSLSSNGTAFDIASNVSMGTITINTWVHLAVGRRNGILYTFKNGALVSSVSAPGTIFSTTTNLFLGRNNATYLAGNIDELRIKNGECLHIESFTPPTDANHLDAGTYYEFNTAEDGTGTNIKEQLTLTGDYGTEGCEFTISSGAQLGHLTIKTYAYGIYSDSPMNVTVEDAASISENGYQNDGIQMVYQQETETGELEAKKVVELERNPRIVLNEITFVANRSTSLMEAYLHGDVGDMIPVQIASDNIDAYFYIQGVKARMSKGIITPSWILKQAWTLEKGLSHVACEFFGGSDKIDFGCIPLILWDTISNFAISAWVWLDAVTNVNFQAIAVTSNDVPGFSLYIDKSATDVVLAFNASHYTSGGVWKCPANAFSTGAWAHILANYNNSSTSNDPLILVNGVAQTLTETATPSGAAQSEKGASLVIGNGKAGTAPFNGKIKDVRFYDMSESPVSAYALASGLYNEDAGGSGYYDGMKFCAFTVRTSELSSFEDLTLTTEKLLDGYMGYVGTPSGSPVVRLI